MYENEYDSLRGEPDYKLLTPELSVDEKAIATRVKPVGTQIFDLRTIAWENGNLGKYLTARMSKQMLIKIIQAINDIGGYIEKSDVNDSREMLVDRIVTACRTMDWNKISIEERQSLPASYEKRQREDLYKQEELDEKKTTRQRVKKPVEV